MSSTYDFKPGDHVAVQLKNHGPRREEVYEGLVGEPDPQWSGPRDFPVTIIDARWDGSRETRFCSCDGVQIHPLSWLFERLEAERKGRADDRHDATVRRQTLLDALAATAATATGASGAVGEKLDRVLAAVEQRQPTMEELKMRFVEPADRRCTGCGAARGTHHADGCPRITRSSDVARGVNESDCVRPR